MSKNILLVTPAARGSRAGNRVTANNWSRVLRELGNHVTVATRYDGQACDVLIALHARKSASAIQSIHHDHPDVPIVLVLTGTDLYRDIHVHKNAKASLNLATRLVLLQPNGMNELPKGARKKVHVIYQAAKPLKKSPAPLKRRFEVAVIGHLREVKDPFRAAIAVRSVPANSHLFITHIGQALNAAMRKKAVAEMDRNSRYRWMGAVPHWRARRLLARSRLMVLSSKVEGGANVLSEAIAQGIPVLASHISGSIGMLGENYSGYFDVGDTKQLNRLLLRCEADQDYYQTLSEECRSRQPFVDPERERREWLTLLSQLPR